MHVCPIIPLLIGDSYFVSHTSGGSMCAPGDTICFSATFLYLYLAISTPFLTTPDMDLATNYRYVLYHQQCSSDGAIKLSENEGI